MSEGQPHIIHETFDVRFENLPSVNILRAHLRLNGEYKDEKSFWDLSITIDVDFSARQAKRYNGTEAPDLSLSPHCTANLRDIFSRVRRIKLFVKARQDTKNLL
jgi:hypothetical protein